MNHEHDGLAAILPADRDPLPGVANGQEGRFVDAVGRGDRHGRRGLRLPPRAIGQTAREHGEHHDDQGKKAFD